MSTEPSVGPPAGRLRPYSLPRAGRPAHLVVENAAPSILGGAASLCRKVSRDGRSGQDSRGDGAGRLLGRDGVGAHERDRTREHPTTLATDRFTGTDDKSNGREQHDQGHHAE
jgi:hypothetical protein